MRNIERDSSEFYRKEQELYCDLTVMKFGGAAMKNPIRVADIIVSSYLNGIRTIGVVSARQGVTDKLEGIINYLDSSRRSSAFEMFKDIYSAHEAWVNTFLDPYDPDDDHEDDQEDEYITKLKREMSEIYIDLAMTIIQDPITPAIKDRILSYGERLGARLVALACHNRGIRTEVVDASSIFVTNNQFGNAMVLPSSEAKTKAYLEKLLQQDIVPIVTGFFGGVEGNPSQVAILGRNTSDYSAALVARYTKAAELVFWKDTQGILDSDPKINPNARMYGLLTFALAQKIPGIERAIQSNVWGEVENSDIVMRVKNFLEPDLPGTALVRSSPYFN